MASIFLLFPQLLPSPLFRGDLGTDLATYADGGALTDALHRASSRLKFVPVVERTIEQPHALVNLKVGRKTVRPAYVSLATRLPMLHGLLSDAQAVLGDYWEGLENCYGVARDVASMAKALHLDAHPLLTSLHLYHNEEKLRLLHSAIYRSDMQSRFLSRKEARKQHVQAAVRENRGAAAVLLQGVQRRTYESVEDVMAACALEHLRAVVKTGDPL